MTITTFTKANLADVCDLLSERDQSFGKIIRDHGHPPFLVRRQGFPSLIRLILEQQVSLLSARAAYGKLLEKAKEITPENIIRLSNEELRQCYFSRQKAGYARTLSEAVITGQLRITEWANCSDDEVRNELIQIKGIGSWTADNYLLLCLHRPDIFPVGDVALVNSIKKIKGLPANTSKEDILELAEPWRPFRSVAALLFWHAYLIDHKIRIDHLEY